MYAKYTEFLRDLMMNEESREALNEALSTYPLYTTQNPSISGLIPTRDKLNEKLLNHYKYREIGFETVGRFLDELKITMCEIMPRYNELFKTVEIMAELPSPFDNVDVTETFEQESSQTASSQGSSSQNVTSNQSGTSSQTAENTQITGNSGTSSAVIGNKANSKMVESDTPQDDLSITGKNIDSVSYASKVTWNENDSEGSETRHTEDSSISGGNSSSESSSSSEGTTNSESSSSGSSDSTGTVKHTFTKKGNQGVNTYAHDMNEFRTSIIDVVNQIINDKRINELFMIVY